MRSRRSSLFTLTFMSEFSGFGYEIVWTRMLSVSLGHEGVSVRAVISAFICGLTAGAWSIEGMRARPLSRQIALHQ